MSDCVCVIYANDESSVALVSWKSWMRLLKATLSFEETPVNMGGWLALRQLISIRTRTMLPRTDPSYRICWLKVFSIDVGKFSQ